MADIKKRIDLGAVISMVLLLSVIFGCPALADSNATIDYGRFEGAVYLNDYFGLSVVIPEGWQVQNEEMGRQLRESGKEVIAGDDQNLRAKLDAGEKNTLYLIMMFKYPLGSTVDFNPSFGCVAEKVGQFPGIKRGADYLFHAKRLLQNGRMKFRFEKEIYSEMIGNVSFDVLEAKMDYAGMTIVQKYYAAIMKNYALGFIVSYTTDEQFEQVNAIIQSIKFSS